MSLNKMKATVLSGVTVAGLLGASVAVSASAEASVAKTSINYSTCNSLAACGGMSALIKAAKAEGQLNVITLPTNWANYGTIMADFTKAYGIHITDANPEGSSQDEINAINADLPTRPDVVDVSLPHAAVNDALFAPYEVATWKNIPTSLKDVTGHWFADYGGNVAIGYDSSIVKTAPTSFKSLLNPIYKNEVGINGDPNDAGAAFAAVMAASIANGGSVNNIKPGIDFFQKLKKEGNYVPVTSGPATVQNHSTPIVIWWDYLQASEISPVVKGWKIIEPTDATYQGDYFQAIAKNAPNPAAARLWEEYLYSTTGQNLFLQGLTVPVEYAAMAKAGTLNKAFAAKLPAPAKGAPAAVSASQAQQTAAAQVLLANWGTEVGDFSD